MLLIRNRAELKAHLENRVSMLDAQYRNSSGEAHALAAGQRMEGVIEALECIDAWERYETEDKGERS
jgi:hypothetical protein